MTVAALPSTVDYVENGITVAFPVPFRFKAASDLVVERILPDGDGVITLVLNVDYTVTGGSSDAGGTLTRAAATNGATLRIRRRTARAQPMIYNAGDRFPAESHEEALDRGMLISQELDAAVADVSSRALVFPLGEVVTPPSFSFAQMNAMIAAGFVLGVTQLASNIGFLAQGAGAVGRTTEDKMREIAVSIVDYHLAAELDWTPALDRAIAALGPNGGVIEIPLRSDIKFNGVIAHHNIVLHGKGGRGEFDVACVRPFDLTKPTLTFGDDINDYRDCGLVDMHVSGSDGTPADADHAASNGVYHAAHQAPQALLLKGGTVNFLAENCTFYNGLQTVALVPSMTNPVTGSKFIGCKIRSDLLDSAAARSIYGIRRSTPDGGYLTSNKFIATKVNGPALGYAVEMDGTALGITTELNDCYIDVKPGHGVLLKGGTALVCFNLQIDPGASPVVIIETDQSIAEIARFISGMMRHGGQKVKFAGGVEITLPAEADIFSYKQRIGSPHFGQFGFFGPPSDPFSEALFYNVVGGVFQWAGAAHAFLDTTQATSPTAAGLVAAGGLGVGKDARIKGDVYVYGNNAIAGGTMSVTGAGGGLYLAALGVNQNIRLAPSSGSAGVFIEGYGLLPWGTQSIGSNASPFQDGFFVNAITVTSDETLKQWRGGLTPAHLRAGKRIMGEIGFFQWLSSIAESGDAARWHCGVRAQRAVQIFVDEGLEAAWGDGAPSFRHAFFCWSSWEEETEAQTELIEEPRACVQMVPTGDDDDEGRPVLKAVEGMETVTLRRATGEMQTVREAGSRFMLRPDELLMFLTAVNHERLNALEAAA